jgi:predicted dienelactone hydrolase
MRLFECLFVIAESAAIIAVLILHGRTPSWLVGLIAAALLLILVHGVVEGPHWQLAPAYFAGCLLVVWLMPAYRMHAESTAVVAGALVVVSLGLCWALPMFRFPKPSGEYPVGTRIFDLTDESRAETHTGTAGGRRRLVVQLWYPSATARGRRERYRRWKETTLLSSYQAVLRTDSIQDAPVAKGRFPVVVFNHAWGGFRNRCTYSIQDLASHGFVVAAISHTHNTAAVVFDDGRVVRYDQFDIGFDCPYYIPLEERLALADEELRVQTEDCRFVLDTLERFDGTAGHPLAGRIDVSKVGCYGFSYGGAVAVEWAREDDRVLSALELDGVLHGVAAREGLNKPLMVIDSVTVQAPEEIPAGLDQLAESTMRMMQLSAEAKRATLSRFGGYAVYLGRMHHGSFSDRSFMSPWRRLSGGSRIPARRCAQILNGYVLAFFQQTLLRRPSPLLAAEARVFPEAELTVYQGAESAGRG